MLSFKLMREAYLVVVLVLNVVVDGLNVEVKLSVSLSLFLFFCFGSLGCGLLRPGCSKS
jgi:hypothetical protein